MLQSAQLTFSMSPLNPARPCASGPSQAASPWWSVTITAGPTACPAASCRSMNVACAFHPKPSSKPKVQVKPNLINLFGFCCLELVSILFARKQLRPERVLQKVGFLFHLKPSENLWRARPRSERSGVHKETFVWPRSASGIILTIFAELSLVLVSLSCCHLLLSIWEGLCLTYCIWHIILTYAGWH